MRVCSRVWHPWEPSAMVLERKVRIVNKLGLHARPSTQFAETAKKFGSAIVVRGNGREVDGKSVIGMLTLGAEEGAELSITADGDDAPQAVSALEELINGKFGEE
ncbi:MAG: HPr family phosphocarrier protein [Planctomycetes bacterium]|nr:HPr family phosphocarrier protein [Planctomycetota bacterium]